MRYHPELGWVRAQLPNWGLGINEEGFRYPTIPQEKPAETWRAFTMGDSQTYGAGVDWDKSYAAFAERALQTEPGGEVQLVNAGISGYGSLQVKRLIELKLLDWDPDMLIVDCRTYDSPRDDVMGPMGAPSGLEQILFYSRAYYAIRLFVEELRPDRARPMRPEAMEMSREEMAGTFGNHALIVELAEDAGVDLIFVNYPFWDNHKDEVICLAPDSELPEGVNIARVCEALQRSGQEPSELFLDNNHLTERGNEVVGEALAEAIREVGLRRR